MRQDKRILNRDAVGLGKTLQAVHASEPPVLIACPAYLVSHWRDWLSANTNGFNVMVCSGSTFQKYNALRTPATHYIISYASIDNATVYNELLAQAKAQKFRTIIFDEAHRLRNHKSQRSRSWKLVAHPRNSEYLFLLTGSPIWKEVDDLFHLFHMMHPDLFPSYNEFTAHYCDYDDTYFARKIHGVKANMQKPLQDMLDLLSIGRSYETAGRELPSTVEYTHTTKLPPDLQKMYDSAVEWGLIEMEKTYDYDENENVVWKESPSLEYNGLMAIIHALRQITAFPGKIEIAEDIIDDLDADIRTVVFTWYKETADRAYRYLSEKGYSATLITGEMDADTRRSIAMNQENRIICTTLGALSEGIDLSDVRNVIFLEEHWAFGQKIQALGRIQRDRAAIAQPKGYENSPIFLHYVMVENSIDSHIHNVAASREGTAKEVLNRSLGR